MGEHEKAHLDTFTSLMRERRVRPSALLPLWNIAGYALGTCVQFMYARSGIEKHMECRWFYEQTSKYI